MGSINESTRRKNRTGSFRAVLALLFMVFSGAMTAGCTRLDAAAVQLGLMPNPYYQEGDTEWDNGGIEEYCFNQIPSGLNEIYRELYQRLKNGEDEAELYARVRTDDFWTAYYAVLSDHPELFWIGTNIQVQESALTGQTVSYHISVTVPPGEREEMRGRLEAAADLCIGQIDPAASDYEKIRFVYEYIINTTDYGLESDANQNIQSALLDHVSVCAGYARSFQYILHRMGMFCTYVTGQTADGGDHAWNIVRIGDSYYNVDVTWGDPVFAGASEGKTLPDSYMNYNYLCCTDEELLRTHVPDTQIPLPSCSDDSYNYYRMNGLYYETFDYDTIYDVLMNSVWNGESRVVMKFAGAEAYEEAKYELFSNGMLGDAAQYLMETNGVSSWNYSYNTDDLFNLITIYW